MAKTLCRVAGGGKPLKGNAEAGDVLAGKTFSNKQSNALTGSMPNNGTWTSSSSGSGKVTIPAGYHNGSGYVDCSGAYNKGVTDADNRANSNSANYKAGYNAGYTNGRGYFKTFSISAKGCQTATTNISITGCSNYRALSASNIKVGVTNVSAKDHSWVSWRIGVAVAGYNPNTGIVTVQVQSSENTESVINFNGFAAVVK